MFHKKKENINYIIRKQNRSYWTHLKFKEACLIEKMGGKAT